ncbi:hypothetical protein F8M41_000309 [Gigaspora margarita]|uniref:Uncharacterized protein n=1 Tax=Gigaspora margarita TaxID=4874 RepID=A0A8H3XGX3_GIGMA|nr:hypothetical protein F8M41_000309 [Gigaspora margarita]
MGKTCNLEIVDSWISYNEFKNIKEIGYSYPDDPYILHGSCRLENFRPNNNNNYQNFWPGDGGGSGFYPRHDSFDQYSSQSEGGIGQNFWTGLGLGAVAGYFISRNNSLQWSRYLDNSFL